MKAEAPRFQAGRAGVFGGNLEMAFRDLQRITFDPAVMGGKPCIHRMGVMIGTILGLMASGDDHVEVLQLYPFLEDENVSAALAYGSFRSTSSNG